MKMFEEKQKVRERVDISWSVAAMCTIQLGEGRSSRAMQDANGS